MQQDFELRKTVRGAGANYKVIKNRIAEKAAEGTPAGGAVQGSEGHVLDRLYLGRSGGAGQGADGVRQGESERLRFKAGMVEGRVVDVAGIQALATLPPKEEIYAKLLYLINAPAQRLVTAMSGVGRNLAVVVDQGVKENKFS